VDDDRRHGLDEQHHLATIGTGDDSQGPEHGAREPRVLAYEALEGSRR